MDETLLASRFPPHREGVWHTSFVCQDFPGGSDVSGFPSYPLRRSLFVLRRSALQGFSAAVLAAASPLRKLEDEVLCSVCPDYLKDPVTIDCGHVSCSHRIIKMASIVENIWRMKADEERQPREDRPLAQRAEQLCRQHLEKLHYYCKDDQRMVCVTCRESQEYRHHAAVLLEKAAQPYQGPSDRTSRLRKTPRDQGLYPFLTIGQLAVMGSFEHLRP
ncbi:hypothetical protein CapIbe_019542 [Capra ibex]